MNLHALVASVVVGAQPHGGEVNLVLPDLASVSFLGMRGSNLLLVGILVSLAGLVFGLVISGQLKRLPVHRSMLEISVAKTGFIRWPKESRSPSVRTFTTSGFAVKSRIVDPRSSFL